MKIGIVDYGHVGKAMHKLFTDAKIYDKYLKLGSKEEINNCDTVFICVPTPQKEDGSCDTKNVEEVIKWVNANLIILRSTVAIGFTRKMTNKYNKAVVFQPEYYGETVDHPFANLKNQNWLSFGATEQKFIDLAIETYQTIFNSNIRIYMAQPEEVEMAKYMENAFYATKVTFCNEMYDICQKMNINYNQVREIWTADPRIGNYHTFVYKNNRGFGGSCLPKDTNSLLFQSEKNGYEPDLLKTVLNKNKKYQNK